MFSVKNKFILGFIVTLWLYLAFRANHVGTYYNSYDFLILLIFVFGGWFILFNHRYFVMSRKILSQYYFECELEYKPYIKDGIVENIFVRLKNTDNWYELDYVLTINKNCNVHQYNDFVKKNGTVRRLLRTMNTMAEDPIVKLEYKRLKTDYNSIRWIMLFVILLSLFLLSLIIYSNNMYY